MDIPLGKALRHITGFVPIAAEAAHEASGDLKHGTWR